MPPNKPLQLTRSSAFQFRFGSILAARLIADSASEALLRAAERLIRWAAECARETRRRLS